MRDYPNHPVAAYWLAEMLHVGGLRYSTYSEDAITPAAYRQLAALVADVTDSARDFLQFYADEVSRLRQRRKGPRGRAPSVSMQHLLETADRNGAGIAEVARRLARAGVVPETIGGKDPDPDLAARWEVILKSAKRRRK